MAGPASSPLSSSFWEGVTSRCIGILLKKNRLCLYHQQLCVLMMRTPILLKNSASRDASTSFIDSSCYKRLTRISIVDFDSVVPDERNGWECDPDPGIPATAEQIEAANRRCRGNGGW